MRVEHEKKQIAKQAAVIDVHDLLHSIFWGKPTRSEMKEVFDRLSASTTAHKVSLMQSEIDELVETGLTKLGKGVR